MLAATLAAYRTPAPLGVDAAPTVFSAARAREILKELVGDGVPHPMGSIAAAKVRDLIVKRLTALGYATELQTGLSCNEFGACGTPTNIVATRGELSGNDAVMLAAHYDSVPAGPGASDDGVGVANLLEIARVLRVMPAPKHPIVLLVTDGEEGGLLGASLLHASIPWRSAFGLRSTWTPAVSPDPASCSRLERPTRGSCACTAGRPSSPSPTPCAM